MAELPFNRPFPGSYSPQDCLFLLRPIQGVHTPVEEKERLIQSGKKHYSELISIEQAPGADYVRLFIELTERYKARLAQDILTLAELIRIERAQPITLVSLARAGTPIGALLQRALSKLGAVSRHYSISIIRDRGIDERALAYLVKERRFPAEGVVFIDGWTAKGVIAQTLKEAVARWNRAHPERLSDALFVVCDIGGVADRAASYQDYVIPSGIMNATVSGLVSRSVLNDALQPGDFHGCLFYEQLRPYDHSRWFLEVIDQELDRAVTSGPPAELRALRFAMTQAYLRRLQTAYRITDINRIKPGIAEATRVMLRRVPDRLLLRDAHCPDVAHLKVLAREKRVAIERDATMPFNAVALIRGLQR